MTNYINVDDLRCPLCGNIVKWSCPAKDGSIGSAHCQGGPMVSRVFPKNAKKCWWAGTKVVRGMDGEVYVELPLPLDQFPSGDAR